MTTDHKYALNADKTDSLKGFRKFFHIPKVNGKEVIYLCGNSLGLQPKGTKQAIVQELEDWAKLGVDGHVHAQNPWVSYHKLLTANTAKIVGAKPIEVSTMNSLTANLNFLLVSFYRPTAKRFKIITEFNAFSSDSYALEMQCRFHGIDPKKAIIEIKPRKGEHTIRHEDIVASIKEHGKEAALVLFSGINFYNGQAYNIKGITEAAHAVGAYAGFDLAHSAGNTELKLHQWKVDFAVWCTYKFLNAGPGAVGQLFIHEVHASNFKLPRFAGWWGHDEKERFLMQKGFKPMPGADGWAQSNVNIVSSAALNASLQLFAKADIKNLVEKSQALTAYLEFLLKETCNANPKDPKTFKFKIITPVNKKERGAQLSLLVKNDAKKLFELLNKDGFVVDYRNPDVVRISPTPLYNSFEDVYNLVDRMKKICAYTA